MNKKQRYETINSANMALFHDEILCTWRQTKLTIRHVISNIKAWVTVPGNRAARNQVNLAMHPIGWPVDAWKDAETSEAGTRGDGYPVEEAPLTNYRDSAKSVTGESLSSAPSLHGKIHLHRATYQMR